MCLLLMLIVVLLASGAASVESAISKDAVDAMVKDVLSPVIDPLIAYLYRTPATAELLKPLIGKGTPLVSAK